MDGHDAPPSLLEVVCYAPLGLVLVARDELPRAARQRRQAVENRVQLARWIGQIAVQQARRQLDARWAAARQQAAARHTAAPATEPAPTPADEPASTADGAATGAVSGPTLPPEPVATPAAPAAQLAGSAVPTADELPIAGYESLAAQHVVQRLASLRHDELELIRRFEEAHRRRRTILAKLDQLHGG